MKPRIAFVATLAQGVLVCECGGQLARHGDTDLWECLKEGCRWRGTVFSAIIQRAVLMYPARTD